jgi:valyl-tRNA synthetase
LRRLGFAFDWPRERFTMDAAYHDVFIDWFQPPANYQ